MWSSIRQRCTYALVMSVAAMTVALGGTAWAAATLTTAHVKNSSLTSKDVKNGSLARSNVAASTLKALAVPGAQGPKGEMGAQGEQGAAGTVGQPGRAAENAYAWAYHKNDNLLRMRSSNNFDTMDEVADPWFSQAGTGDWTEVDAGYSNVKIELADGSNDGLLVLEEKAVVVATASLTVVHEESDVHSRLECRLRITNITTNSQENLGQPVMVSSDVLRQILTFNIVGARVREAGTYAVRTECRDLDLKLASYHKWAVAKGNLSVLTSKGNLG